MKIVSVLYGGGASGRRRSGGMMPLWAGDAAGSQNRNQKVLFEM
jgi:hypothetical protein